MNRMTVQQSRRERVRKERTLSQPKDIEGGGAGSGQRILFVLVRRKLAEA